VRVAAAEGSPARVPAHASRKIVGRRGHHAVARLDHGEAAEAEVQVIDLAPTGQRRERVVDAGWNALLGEVGEERLRVAAPP
jgi:hypothetical protein